MKSTKCSPWPPWSPCSVMKWKVVGCGHCREGQEKGKEWKKEGILSYLFPWVVGPLPLVETRASRHDARRGLLGCDQPGWSRFEKWRHKNAASLRVSHMRQEFPIKPQVLHIFDSWSLVYSMSNQQHDIVCTEDELSKIEKTESFMHKSFSKAK